MEWLTDPENVKSLFTFITAVIAAYVALVTKATKENVKDVHTLVNSRLDLVLSRVDKLETLLADNDINIPPDNADMPRLPGGKAPNG